MQAVTEGKFDAALNAHYANCGYECTTIEEAKHHLKTAKFKEIGTNIYRNDKYRTAYLTSLRAAKCNKIGEITGFRPTGWLITFSGNEPISYNERTFLCKRQ